MESNPTLGTQPLLAPWRRAKLALHAQVGRGSLEGRWASLRSRCTVAPPMAKERPPSIAGAA